MLVMSDGVNLAIWTWTIFASFPGIQFFFWRRAFSERDPISEFSLAVLLNPSLVTIKESRKHVTHFLYQKNTKVVNFETLYKAIYEGIVSERIQKAYSESTQKMNPNKLFHLSK